MGDVIAQHSNWICLTTNGRKMYGHIGGASAEPAARRDDEGGQGSPVRRGGATRQPPGDGASPATKTGGWGPRTAGRRCSSLMYHTGYTSLLAPRPAPRGPRQCVHTFPYHRWVSAPTPLPGTSHLSPGLKILTRLVGYCRLARVWTRPVASTNSLFARMRSHPRMGRQHASPARHLLFQAIRI